MKQVCPICEEEKETVGPKVVGSGKVHDDRFTKPIDTRKNKVMCQDCWEEIKRGGQPESKG